LLNEYNKDKVEAQKRKQSGRPHSHSRPHPRPPRPNGHGPSYLAPPSHPPRPLSAPPQNQQQQNNSGYWQKLSRPPQYQQRPPHPSPRPQWQHGPPPNAQSTQPGPPALQHPNTFHDPQQPPFRPYVQHSNTLPQQPQQQFHPNYAPAPPPPQQQQQPLRPQPQTQSSGHAYIDSKTGKVSHNLYPPDHPMARGESREDSGTPGDSHGESHHPRFMTSRSNEDDLAYGKNYSDLGRRRSNSAY